MIAFFYSLMILLAVVQDISAFQVVSRRPSHSFRSRNSRLYSQDIGEVQDFLAENYPAFFNLIEKNNGVWKALGDGDGFTVFAPTDAAFSKLSEKERQQLADVRNSETTEKIGAYHAIAETVSADALYNAGGVVTIGGEVPVDRSVSGGMFGMGGKEDGGVVISNKAKVTQSVEVGAGVVHEVNDLVSPKILWRYMDQLRIPGSN